MEFQGFRRVVSRRRVSVLTLTRLRRPGPAGADGVCGVGRLATAIEPGARPADRKTSRGSLIKSFLSRMAAYRGAVRRKMAAISSHKTGDYRNSAGVARHYSI